MYLLRYFFDPGAGICLWAGNDDARERFDYAIDASTLPFPENTWRRVIHLCSWYDTSIDWNYPPGSSPWNTEEFERFHAAAQKLLALLREQLGPEFEIVDASGTADQV
jgi:hypothetical protein